MPLRIALIDYHKGNVKSVERGLMAAGDVSVVVTDKPQEIEQADALVLPGVGAFTDAARSMEMLGYKSMVARRIAEGIPFLGICLGQHLLFEEGVEGAEDTDEGVCKGLGVLPGTVYRMPSENTEGTHFKIPHVGWNTVEGTGPLFEGIEQSSYFYFTHSFIAPASEYTCATTTHSVTFPSAVQYGSRAFGVQFHPEKSSDAGMALLKNFVRLAKGA